MAARDRRTRSATGASGDVLAVPGVANGRGDAAQRELVCVGLAHDDHAGLLQSPNDGRGRRGGCIGGGEGAAACGEALDVVEVLHSQRDAVEGSAIVAGEDLRLGGLRLTASVLGRHQGEGVHLLLSLLDPLERRLHNLDG